jgi:hypothetical protein
MAASAGRLTPRNHACLEWGYVQLRALLPCRSLVQMIPPNLRRLTPRTFLRLLILRLLVCPLIVHSTCHARFTVPSRSARRTLLAIPSTSCGCRVIRREIARRLCRLSRQQTPGSPRFSNAHSVLKWIPLVPCPVRQRCVGFRQFGGFGRTRVKTSDESTVKDLFDVLPLRGIDSRERFPLSSGDDIRAKLLEPGQGINSHLSETFRGDLGHLNFCRLRKACLLLGQTEYGISGGHCSDLLVLSQ